MTPECISSARVGRKTGLKASVDKVTLSHAYIETGPDGKIFSCANALTEYMQMAIMNHSIFFMSTFFFLFTRYFTL